jgi:chemotaxis protein CheC
MEQTLSPLQLDAFNETANVGAGQAATAFSVILDQSVNIGLPIMKFATLREIGSSVSSTKGQVVGVFTKLTKGPSGNILLILPPDSAAALLETLGRPRAGEQLEKEDFDILNKVGTVLCAGYLTGLAKFFEQHIEFKKPRVVSSTGTSIVDFAGVDMNGNEELMLLRIDFTAENTRINGSFVLLFTVASIVPYFDAFMKRMGAV